MEGPVPERYEVASAPISQEARKHSFAQQDVRHARIAHLCGTEQHPFGQLCVGKKIILGVARTGAKFTPHNHHKTGNVLFDTISSGDTIRCNPEEIANELGRLYALGVRYMHEHARNPSTREQTCETGLYRSFGELCAALCPDALVSFGASRNGPEIDAAVSARGEWARIAHTTLSRAEGGAHFVTSHAAVELQIVKDMERQGYVRIDDAAGTFEILRDLRIYEPSANEETIDLPVHSTSGGRNYGRSSGAMQLAVLRRSIKERLSLGLPFEVEWVQTARSAMLTWYLANMLEPGLRDIGRLNITILFGFSPRLPFPDDYAAFKSVVDKAHAIGNCDHETRPLKVSVTCGAAVLPQHAARHVRPIDVGLRAGVESGPLERMLAYACQPDSKVDIVRVGLEDTPYILDPAGVLLPATNLLLAQEAVRQIEMNGARVITEQMDLQRFLARQVVRF
jgi:hypothetical protein